MMNPTLTSLLRTILVAATTSALIAGGGFYMTRVPQAHAAEPGGAVAVADAGGRGAGPMITLPDFAEIVARQGPAVVNISVASNGKKSGFGFHGMPKIDPNDPFYEFFKRFQIPMPQEGVPMPRHGAGSGFIVSDDGLILTNAHVVADADEVTVKLIDKREFKAKVIGSDKTSDVAVIKIDAKNLPVVHTGSSDKARVGEWVLAIGSPFGFENSVTAGIVSAKSRSLPDEGYVPFLQTDVAINPGNSGGPLFNLNGEVIGINSQIYSRSGGYQGLSFAIPIEVALKVKQQLLDHGKVSRGRLGVYIQEINQALADSFGLDKPAGALVSSVEKGSPAERAGIEAGDVILKFNGREIVRSSELPPLVADAAPGASARLEIWRKGKRQTLEMKVGEMDAAAKAKPTPEESSQLKGKLGLSIRPLTSEESKGLDGADGLRVEEVGDGPAARAGIRPGDVILSVNGEKVTTVEQLRKRLDKGGKKVALQILRGERRLFVPITLD